MSLSPSRFTHSPAARARRWFWTRTFTHLGLVGATVLGMAVALQGGGGADGNTLLLAWMFGLPFSFPLAWLPAFGLNVQGTAAAAWGWSHAALAVSTVASWAALGATVDQVVHRFRLIVARRAFAR